MNKASIKLFFFPLKRCLRAKILSPIRFHLLLLLLITFKFRWKLFFVWIFTKSNKETKKILHSHSKCASLPIQCKYLWKITLSKRSHINITCIAWCQVPYDFGQGMRIIWIKGDEYTESFLENWVKLYEPLPTYKGT